MLWSEITLESFESQSLNLNFFFGLMSSNGGILGSTSVVVGWDGCGSSVCFSVDVPFLVGDVLSLSDLAGFLPGSYSHPVMDVKNFFLST